MAETRTDLPGRSGLRRAVGASMAGKAAELVTLALLATVVPRALGPHDYGRFAVPLTIVTLGTLALSLGGPTVLAYPSLDEGFGFPVLEAQAVGVPIVATSAGSIPEVAGDGAVLVEVGDVHALAHALVRAVTDDALRQALVVAGTGNLDRFDWARTADELVALYRDLVDG